MERRLICADKSTTDQRATFPPFGPFDFLAPARVRVCCFAAEGTFVFISPRRRIFRGSLLRGESPRKRTRHRTGGGGYQLPPLLFHHRVSPFITFRVP